MQAQKYTFLTSPWVSGWLGICTSCKTALCIHWIGDWLGYITGLDMLINTARKQICIILSDISCILKKLMKRFH
jgi:hypothetical protein